MTREILFRGKWTRNGKWIEGFYARIHDGKGNVSHRIYTGYAESNCGDFYPENFEVDPSTIGQFTGLTANGKKIFEGDIVKPLRYEFSINSTELVEYDGGGFTPFAIPGWECTIEPCDVTVIGNKWDNPELLEDGG